MVSSPSVWVDVQMTHRLRCRLQRAAAGSFLHLPFKQYFTLPHVFRADPCGLHGLCTELVGLRTDPRGIHGLRTELVGLHAELVRLHTELVGLHTDGASPDFM